MMQENENARKAFLIEWYKILWNNARQSMDTIWKLIGPITLVGTIWVAIFKDYIPYNLGNSLVFIILFWAINITIDYNQWHRRNLIFYTAVEREFFKPDDYGRLIPAKFKNPKSSWVSFYLICLTVFCAMLLFAIIYALCATREHIDHRMDYPYHWWLLFIGLGLSVWNFIDSEKSTRKYIHELFGKKE